VLVLELVVVEDELTVDVVLAVLIGLFEDETEIEGLSDNEKLGDPEADIDFSDDIDIPGLLDTLGEMLPEPLIDPEVESE
jgi:hypothetical protein